MGNIPLDQNKKPINYRYFDLTLAMIHPTCLHLCTKLLSKARKGDAIHPEKSALFTIYWLSERKKNGIFRLSKSGNIKKQVINLIDPCFFGPVAKVFGTVITGSDEWIYHIHNVLWYQCYNVLHCKYDILSFYDKICTRWKTGGFSRLCWGFLSLLCGSLAR